MRNDFPGCKLHDIADGDEGNKFCGPGALAIVTGCRTLEAARAIRSVAPNWYPVATKIRGVYVQHLGAALRGSGVKVTLPQTPELLPISLRMLGTSACYSGEAPETLGQWLDRTEGLRGDGVYLIVTTKHFGVVHRNWYNDNNGGRPRGKVRSVWHKSVQRRAKLRQVWLLTTGQVSE